jgi:DNA replication protein
MTNVAQPPRRRFPGFPDRMQLVPIPAAIFGTLLREIDDLQELKTLLHVLRLLHDQPRAPRFVSRASLQADAGLIDALGLNGEHDGQQLVSEAIDRAVERGTLLPIRVTDGVSDDECYLLNTRANERIVHDVLAGRRTLGELGPAPVPREPAPAAERPTVFELYEQNIGLLTPLLGEELREAADTYPADWVEDAFREAVAQNKRNWRYVQRILESWASRGRGTNGTTGRRPDPPEDARKYLEGRYGRLVRR